MPPSESDRTLKVEPETEKKWVTVDGKKVEETRVKDNGKLEDSARQLRAHRLAETPANGSPCCSAASLPSSRSGPASASGWLSRN